MVKVKFYLTIYQDLCDTFMQIIGMKIVFLTKFKEIP